MITLSELRTKWQRLWFTPTSPAPFCVFRILLGLIVIVSSVHRCIDADVWYAQPGMFPVESTTVYTNGYKTLSLFSLITPSHELVVASLSVLIIAAISMTLGFKTRLSAFLTWILVLSFNHRNPFVLNCGDSLMQIALFLVTLGPAGAMYSIDAAMNKGGQDQRVCEPWAQRLMQLQIALVYVSSFFCKYGPAWWNGTASYYAMHVRAYALFQPPHSLDQLWISQLFTLSTLAVEFSLFTLIGIKEFRYWVLLAGLIFHVGLLFTMNFAYLQLLMIASYVNFVRAEDVEKNVELIKRFMKVGSRVEQTI